MNLRDNLVFYKKNKYLKQKKHATIWTYYTSYLGYILREYMPPIIKDTLPARIIISYNLIKCII